MTDPRGGSARRYAGLVTTAIVSLGTAAAVGWAAATPLGGSSRTAAEPVSSATTTRTAHQIDAARIHLQHVRKDLARALSREDNLPRVKLANLPALVAQLPNVQVPQSSVPPAVTYAAPPVTHTTTGASGAHP